MTRPSYERHACVHRQLATQSGRGGVIVGSCLLTVREAHISPQVSRHEHGVSYLCLTRMDPPGAIGNRKALALPRGYEL